MGKRDEHRRQPLPDGAGWRQPGSLTLEPPARPRMIYRQLYGSLGAISVHSHDTDRLMVTCPTQMYDMAIA